MINPLIVEEVDGGYEVVAGHRRLLAARRAGLVVCPCLVRSSRDASATALQLHENLYRQELTPVEEAAWFAELLPLCGNDTDNLADLVKQSRNYVEGRLNLLHGDPEILAAVAKHEITLGVANELNKIENEKDRLYYLGWARQTGAIVAMVRQWRATIYAATPPTPEGAVLPPSSAPPVVPTRDIFQCFICRQSEPKTDLEFWHIHSFCRLQVEAREKEQDRQDAGATGGKEAKLWR
jgi:ParB/RepB/Spo0J family partition protein